MCDLLWASTTSIDPATLQEAAGSLNAEDAQVIANMAEDAKDAGDESSLTEMGQGQGHSEPYLKFAFFSSMSIRSSSQIMYRV